MNLSMPHPQASRCRRATLTLAACALLALSMLASNPANAGLLPLGQTARSTAADTWSELALTPAQRTALALLLADIPGSRAQARDRTQDFLAQAGTTLANDDADLAALAAAGQQLVDDRLAAARELRDRLILFYDTQLDPRQQAVVRRQLQLRLAQLDGLLTLADELRAALGLP